MEDEDDDEGSVLGYYIFFEGFAMLIEISDTHHEYNSIHEKRPKPDRTRCYPHTIKCDRKSIKTKCYEKHTCPRVSIEGLDRIRKSYMRFLDGEIVGSCEGKEYPEKTIDIHPLIEKENTRKNRRERDEPLHRSNERNISECE
jgi:hypothetical protein